LFNRCRAKERRAGSGSARKPTTPAADVRPTIVGAAQGDCVVSNAGERQRWIAVLGVGGRKKTVEGERAALCVAPELARWRRNGFSCGRGWVQLAGSRAVEEGLAGEERGRDGDASDGRVGRVVVVVAELTWASDCQGRLGDYDETGGPCARLPRFVTQCNQSI
jgi:hypothetical protein